MRNCRTAENISVWERCKGRNKEGSENSSSRDDHWPPPKQPASFEAKSDNSAKTIKETDKELSEDEKKFHLNCTMYEEALSTFKLRCVDEGTEYKRFRAQYTSWRRRQIEILDRKLREREQQKLAAAEKAEPEKEAGVSSGASTSDAQ